MPTDEKNPQRTGNGRNAARLTSLIFAARTHNTPESSIPKALRATKVARKAAESSISSVDSLSLAATKLSSTSAASLAKKGAMNMSRHGYSAGKSLPKRAMNIGHVIKLPTHAISAIGARRAEEDDTGWEGRVIADASAKLNTS
mmetsp:Transcript_20261/g.42499  ORF Transcript_20261/g.42499 Transcript_20261/m.42499 type:complete len:144 (+) Transcript_20261:2840-3271(+)